LWGVLGEVLDRRGLQGQQYKQLQSLPGELLWDIKTVIQKTGLSRATIYRYVERNLFPPRRRIGPNRVAWLAAEVVARAESRPRGEGPSAVRHAPLPARRSSDASARLSPMSPAIVAPRGMHVSRGPSGRLIRSDDPHPFGRGTQYALGTRRRRRRHR
jgi:prophage regulatory protein